MATEGAVALKLTGLKAGADLSALQYTFVKISGAGTVDTVTGTTDNACGVLQNKPTKDQPAEIVCIGETKIKAGVAFTAGNKIGTAADGTLAVYTAAAAEDCYVLGFVKDTDAGTAGLASAVINCAHVPHGGS